MPRRVDNPPNPWEKTRVEWAEWAEWIGPPPEAPLEVYEEEVRSILSSNDSPDLGFTFSVNPYRGCQHACAYCYARPTHQYLSFGAGTDFDTKIVVKINAPELLARELASRRLRGETVVFSGVTDCYQPLEASYGLTRKLLEVCLARRQKVAIISKSALLRRDVELLAELHRAAGVEVTLSIPFADDAVGRAIEPFAAAPRMRFETLHVLAEAGIPCGVAIAPLIPGLNDCDVAKILRRARAAGATSAFMVLLRLPAEVEPVFRKRLVEAFPLRAKRVLAALGDMRAGSIEESRFGARMHGVGERWKSVRQLFELECKRLSLATTREAPARPRQGLLFG
jgi:DNA repair photolyase